MPTRARSDRNQVASVSREGAASPWWLGGGGEQCPDCDGTYAYEMEYRCVACDAPICPLCVVRVRRTVLCSGCSARGGG